MCDHGSINACAYGITHIEEDASITSFKGCLLDKLHVHKKDVIVELRDTVVAGDIVFDHPGTLVVDKKTVFGGIIYNARIMKAKE